MYATVIQRTSGFAVDILICVGKALDRTNRKKNLTPRIRNKFQARKILRSAPRGARPNSARTPSETHAPQLHPYTADVAKRDAGNWSPRHNISHVYCVTLLSAQ